MYNYKKNIATYHRHTHKYDEQTINYKLPHWLLSNLYQLLERQTIINRAIYHLMACQYSYNRCLMIGDVTSHQHQFIFITLFMGKIFIAYLYDRLP